MAALKTYIFGRDAVVNLEDQKKFYDELQSQYETAFSNYSTLSKSLLTSSPRATNFPYPFVTELEPLPCQNSTHYDPPIPYDTEDFRKLVQQAIVDERLAQQGVCKHYWLPVDKRGTELCMRCQITRRAS